LHSSALAAPPNFTQAGGTTPNVKGNYMATYVLVHGAWHTGAELQDVAAAIRAVGHEVHTPTIKGNRPGDSKKIGLSEAIASIVEYIDRIECEKVILVAHSYGGMVATGVADRIPHRIQRLVYWNAFVPDDGQSLLDLSLPQEVAAMEAMAEERSDGALLLPFSLWRDVFINDGDEEVAHRSYSVLNPHPMQTFREKISLSTNVADMALGKSFINCTDDLVCSQGYTWLARFSQKLGSFRLVQLPGSHEICFTDPGRIAKAILEAGRD
jgi:pimeloyl-ACP methyl ester carboxylesterase